MSFSENGTLCSNGLCISVHIALSLDTPKWKPQKHVELLPVPTHFFCLTKFCHRHCVGIGLENLWTNRTETLRRTKTARPFCL